MAVNARIGGAEGKVRRVFVALVAEQIPETSPVGDCEPFRGVFRLDSVCFALPTTAVAKGITDHRPRRQDKLHVAVVEDDAGAVSSGTLNPWGSRQHNEEMYKKMMTTVHMHSDATSR